MSEPTARIPPDEDDDGDAIENQHVPKFFLSSRGVSVDVGPSTVRLRLRLSDLLGLMEVEEFTIGYDRAQLPKDIFQHTDELRKRRGTVERLEFSVREDHLSRALDNRYALRLEGFFGTRVRITDGKAAVTGRYLGPEGEAGFLLVFSVSGETGKQVFLRLEDARLYAGIPLPPLVLADRFCETFRGWLERREYGVYAMDPVGMLLPTLVLRCGLKRRPTAELVQNLSLSEGHARIVATPGTAPEVTPPVVDSPEYTKACEEIVAGDREAAVSKLRLLRADEANSRELRARATLALAEASLLPAEDGARRHDPNQIAAWTEEAAVVLGRRAESLRLQALLMAGKLDEALSLLSKIAKGDPPLPDGAGRQLSSLVRALSAWSSRNHEEGRKIFEESWAADPECFTAREALQEVYEAANETDKLSYLNESLLADVERLPPGSLPDLSTLFRRAGVFFDTRGDAERATRCRAVAESLEG